MKKRKKRPSPEQIVRKIQDANQVLTEGGGVAAVFTALNVTEAACDGWRDPRVGLKAKDAKTPKNLDTQNLQLEKPFVETGHEKS